MKLSIKYAPVAAAALLAVVGCSKTENSVDEPINPKSEGVPFVIKASTGSSDTKTTNDTYNTLWAADDAMTVFHAEAGSTEYGDNDKFTVAEAGADGTFNGTLTKALTDGASYDWYMIYPYASKYSTPANTDCYTIIGSSKASSQAQIGNSSMAHLSGKNFPLYAIAKNVSSETVPDVQMKQIASIVRIRVKNGLSEAIKVSNVSFTGTENIVGGFFVNFSTDPVSIADEEGYVSNTANLTVTDGEDIAAGESADFYIGIKPFTAASGSTLTVAVTGTNGTQTKTIDLTKNTSFKSAYIKTLNFTYDQATLVTNTISEMQSIDDKTVVTSNEVIVTALTTMGFVAVEDGNAIYVFQGKDPNPSVAIGDKVTFTGTKTTYDGIPEISSNPTVTVVSNGNSFTYPDANDITSSFGSYSSSVAEYITFTGNLTKSGNYYNIAVEGATITGRATYPVDELGLADLSGHNVTLTGYYNGAYNSNQYIIVTSVKDNATTTNTIEEMISASKGTEVTSNQVLVTAKTTRGFVASENDHAIYVYQGETPDPDVAIGSVVTFTGTKSTNYGVPQITSPTVTVVSTGSAVTYPSANNITSTLESYTNTEAEYITFTGDLTISGTYYNVTVEGTTAYKGSITYPIDGLGLADLSGHNVTVTGYYNGQSGSSTKYQNMIATSVVDNGATAFTQMTIEEMQTSTESTPVKSNNVLVTGLTTRGFMAVENGYAIYVFTRSTPEVSIGDNVVFTGTKTSYNGIPEITSQTVNTNSTGNTVTYPTPNDISSTIDSYSSSVAEYISLTGNLTSVSGSYGHVSVSGASWGAETNCAISSLGLDSLVGHNVTLYGYYNGDYKTERTMNVVSVTDNGLAGVITMSDKSVQVGSTVELGATVNSGATISYSSSNPSVATVNSNGVVTGVAVGTTTITATAPASGEYTAATATCTVTVVAAGALTYTLDGSTAVTGDGSGSTNGYATESEITQNGITWKITGNTQMGPWRIGGKSLTAQDRAIYSTTAIAGNIKTIEVTSGTAKLTVNSLTVTVHSTADDAASGSNAIATFTFTSGITGATVTCSKTDSTSWANCFYRIVYNVTTSGKSNQYVELTKVYLSE